jgi:protein SCO1/2
MRRALMAALLLIALAALSVAAYSAFLNNKNAPIAPVLPNEVHYPVGEFALTERSGRTVSNTDLAGKVWIASFVFTRCTGPCPQVSGTVARLQDAFRDQPDVRFVTFTVDPEHDDPEELKKYAEHFGADPERWQFLTGSEQQLYQLMEKGFKVGVQRNSDPTAQPGQAVTHSTRLALVDRQGNVRAYFDGRQVDEEGKPIDELPKLRPAVEALLREKP